MDARRVTAASLFFVLLLGHASVVAADDEQEEARALFDQAMEARTADDMARAEELLERSLELAPSAPTAFNLAEVQMRLGRACAAADLYAALLSDDFGKLDPARTRDVRRRRGSALRRTARLTIRLSGAASAALTVDAAEATELRRTNPTVLCADVGAHRVSASADGFATAEERVTVDAGEDAEVELALTAIAAAVTTHDEVDDTDGGISPIWWVVAGVLVVGAAVAITAALVLTSGPDQVVDPVWGNKMALHF